ncbi:MAG: hypothetical protein ACHQF0_06215 [Chitinophagales bacterium]
MFSTTLFYPVRLQWSDLRTYFFILLFAAGSLILPQLCHLIPSGGQIFLPIYFFTLIASYKFGLKVGLLTAALSPVMNCIFFGMPPAAALPVILIKSILLAVIAAYVANTFKKISILYLMIVVFGYQLIGSFIEWNITQSFSAAIADLTTGVPGMFIQVFAGWLILKKLASYDKG